MSEVKVRSLPDERVSGTKKKSEASPPVNEQYEKVGSSSTTPVELTKRKEVLVRIPLTNYTLVYHYDDLDKTPVRGVSYRATLSDGSQRLGTLDQNGRADLLQVPSGLVTIEYQYDQPDSDNPQIVEARAKLKAALDAIVEQTRQDLSEEWARWNEAGWLKQHYLIAAHHFKGQAVGAWEWLSGTVQAVWQVALLLYKTDREVHELAGLILTGRFDEVDQRIAKYRAQGETVLAAGGATKELLIQILYDRPTREILAEFGSEWWAAFPPDQQQEIGASVGMQIGIDIVIAVLLSTFSFGAGGATYGSAKWTQRIGKLAVRVARLLDELKIAFEELAVALRSRRRRMLEVKKANSEREIVTVWRDSALVDEVTAEAMERIANQSAAQRGPVLSGFRDNKTGKMHFGENFDLSKEKGRREFAEFKENAHPLVKKRIAMQESAIESGQSVPLPRTGTPGAHSEVVALDKAIKARELETGKAFTESDLPSLTLHNQSMMNGTPTAAMDRCSNCEAITRGVTVVNHE